MSVLHMMSTFVVIVFILWPQWQSVSSSRLLRAPNAPELSPELRHRALGQTPLGTRPRQTYSSPRPLYTPPKPPGLVDIVLLNGGAMVLPATDLSGTTANAIAYDQSNTGRPPTAAAPSQGSSSAHASGTTEQSAPVSRDGILLMALVLMLILAVVAGIDRDGPTCLLLASIKTCAASVWDCIWCRVAALNSALWASVIAGCQRVIGTSAKALQRATLLISSVPAYFKAVGHVLVLVSKSAPSAALHRLHHCKAALAQGSGISSMPVCEIRQQEGQHQQKPELQRSAVKPRPLSAAATATADWDCCSVCMQRSGSNSSCECAVADKELEFISVRAPCGRVHSVADLCSCVYAEADGVTAA